MQTSILLAKVMGPLPVVLGVKRSVYHEVAHEFLAINTLRIARAAGGAGDRQCPQCVGAGLARHYYRSGWLTLFGAILRRDFPDQAIRPRRSALEAPGLLLIASLVQIGFGGFLTFAG
jgi:hypothetical protein